MRHRIALAITAIAALAGGALAAVAPPPSAEAAPSGATVNVTATSLGGDRLTSKAALTFSALSGAPDIRVDSSRQFQAIDGFGGTFNEAGWNTLNQPNVSATQRTAVLNQLFAPSGAGFSLTRTPMGSDDFAMTRYTYDDTSGNAADPSLASFSIAHDLNATSGLVPYIKAAQTAAGGNFRIMASPWTAPAWMKNNKSYFGTPTSTGDASVPASNYSAYASYFAKYVAAYAAQGIPITDVSVQNEPENPANFEATLWSDATMAAFVGGNLGPTFAAQGTAARIRVYEHNQDHWYYPANMLNDPAVKKYAAGANFHPYECDFGINYCLDANLDLFNQAAPGYSTWMSEHTDLGQAEPSNYIRDEKWSREIVKQLQHGQGGYIYWNMVLNQNGGPVEYPSAPQEPLVEVDTSVSPATVSYMPKFYALAQFSKFVRPGAHRIGSEGGVTGSDLAQTAFENPDGSRALVIVNSGPATNITVGEGANGFSAALQAHSTTTFTWSGAVDSYSIDAGSTGSWTDVAGEHFGPDASVTGGTVSTVAASVDIDNTADDALYRSTRDGTFSYALPVPGGRYRVQLLLSDNTSTAAGQRVFSVKGEGVTKVSGLDVFAKAGGGKKATSTSFDLAVSDGVLNLATVAGTGTPTIAAVRVTPIPTSGTQHSSTVQGGVPAGYTTDTGVLPGTIFAQDYNDGGSGVGYSIAAPLASSTGYRTDETNLVATSDTTYGGGQNITGLSAGDKLNYTVDVVAGGNYDIHARVKSTTGTGKYRLQLDGVDIGGVINVANASGAWVTAPDYGVTVPAGQHTLTFVVVAGGFDLRYLTSARVNSLATTSVIEAEDFGPGGEGVGYHDSNAGNGNTTYAGAQLRGYYRGGDVDLEPASFQTSQLDNYDVGSTADGEWLRYDVYSPTTTAYDITTRVASGFNSGRFQFALDSTSNVISPAILNVPNTGGFQTWISETQKLTIPSGPHQLYFLVTQGGFNLDRFVISPSGQGWAKTVGFGSSSAAGPGIDPLTSPNSRGFIKNGYAGASIACGRSRWNQINDLADRQGLRDQFYDASCSGDISGSIANATNSDGTTSSVGDQIAEASAGYATDRPGSGALGSGTTAVTIAIGANDVYTSTDGTFGSSIYQAIDACSKTTVCVDGSGQPTAVVNGKKTVRAGDITAAAMSRNLRPIVDQILLAAPNAQIRFIGYHAALGSGTVSCQDPSSTPQWGFSSAETSYLQGIINAHNDVESTVIAQIRAAKGLSSAQLQFVDIRTETAAHSMCAPLNARWVAHPQNGPLGQVVGTTSASPTPDGESAAALHPNLAMHAVEAVKVAATLP
ncbi:carbohydrate-binding protein [Schumannella soli]|nr:carbohydrate-binding protein [Schumannella soli]